MENKLLHCSIVQRCSICLRGVLVLRYSTSFRLRCPFLLQVKDEIKYWKATTAQRVQEVELLSTELDEVLVFEAEHGRALEEQVLTATLAICANDRARRIAAQLTYDEEQQALSVRPMQILNCRTSVRQRA